MAGPDNSINALALQSDGQVLVGGDFETFNGAARTCYAMLYNFVPSNNADLATLTLSSGTLTPVFDANILIYSAAVSNGTATMAFTPTLSSGQATVTVNGGSAATPVTLNVGSNNVINITVTAQDGTSMQTYIVTVTRRTVFQDWALANSVSDDPSVLGANSTVNLLNFALGMNPNGTANNALIYTGTFAGNGAITATGQPTTRMEGIDIRALFVRRKDFAVAGLTYTVQFSNSLSGWQDCTDTPTVLADDGMNQIVSVPYPAGFTAKGFFHVSVSIP